MIIFLLLLKVCTNLQQIGFCEKKILLESCWDRMKFIGREQPPEAESFDLNSALENIGHFGKFHWLQLSILFAMSLAAGIGSTSFIFTGFVPKYRCTIPYCENANSALYLGEKVAFNDHDLNETYSHLIHDMAVVQNMHLCKRYISGDNVTCESFLRQTLSRGTIEETCRRNEIVFDKSVVQSSFVTRFGLVCDRFPLRGIINSCVMGGMLLGSGCVGILADKLGRKMTLGICILLYWTVGLANAFIPWLSLFAICRILLGIASNGIYMSSLLIAVESTLPKQTSQATLLLSLCWPIGQSVVAIFSYNIRDEQMLQIALYGPYLLMLIPLYFILESTRWLLSNGRCFEARQNVAYMARLNGKVVPEEMKEIGKEASSSNEVPILEAKITDLFKPRRMLCRTLNCFFQWFCISATTFGIAFGSTSLVGNPYFNFAVTIVMSVPVKFLGLYTFDRFGRKWSLIILQLVSGICCISIGLILENEDLGIAQLILASIGKLTSTLCFSLACIYCSEMYPTQLRGRAIGACSMLGSAGAIYSLGIEGIQQIWAPLPFVLMGSQAVLAGLFGFFLPETTGCKLPETKDEALSDVGKNYQLKPWCKT